MALAKGINSYATVSEANAYFENRLNSSKWEEADDGVKSQALVTATSILDSFDWQGIIADETQSLAFPRVGTYFDSKVGYEVSISNSTPVRILHANFELAYHLISNSTLLDDTGTVQSLSIGAISLSSIKSPNKLSPVVKSLIKPLLKNSGANLWWRAN